MEVLFLTRKKFNKKAQVWGLDLIVASVIFLTGIILLYVYAINTSSQTDTQLNELSYEASLASELILSEEDFSIVKNSVINQSKLDGFYNLSYSTQKTMAGVTNNFYFTFDDLEIGGSPVSYVGKMNESVIESLVKTTRVTVYKNKPIKFEIFVYR